jgi:hypothetical protein
MPVATCLDPGPSRITSFLSNAFDDLPYPFRLSEHLHKYQRLNANFIQSKYRKIH